LVPVWQSANKKRPRATYDVHCRRREVNQEKQKHQQGIERAGSKSVQRTDFRLGKKKTHNGAVEKKGFLYRKESSGSILRIGGWSTCISIGERGGKIARVDALQFCREKSGW